MPSTEVADQIKNYPAKHLRVLGLPGSGKTRLLIDRYKALAGDSARRVFILTYSGEQRRRIIESILDDGSAVGGLSPVLTHFTLAQEITAATNGKPPRIIHGLQEAMLVQRIINERGGDLKSEYKNIRESESFQRELLQLVHFFLQNGIRGEKLTHLQKQAKGYRTIDILSLYQRFVAALDRTNQITFYDLSWQAVECCEGLPASHPLGDGVMLLIDDFQDIDRGQFELLKALAPPDGQSVLNVFGDPMGSYFGFRGTQACYLMNDFPEVYRCETLRVTSQPLDPASLNKTLTTLSREVLGDLADAFSPPLEPSNLGPLFDGAGATTGGRVTMECVEDEVQEIYAAAARVHEMIATGGYKPNEIAVVANDKSLYEPMLRAAFGQRGISLDTGRPSQGVFRDFVFAMLGLLRFPRDGVAMQALTTSPFYAHFRTESLRAKPVGKDRDGDFDLVVGFFEGKRKELNDIPPAEWAAHLIKHCLYDALAPYRRETEDESGYVFLSALSQRWQEYVTALEATRERPDFGVFVRISELFQTASTAPAPTLDEVGFYSCREARGKFFRAVLLLGCSELIFPSVLRRESIMPVTELQKLLDTAPDLAARLHTTRTPQQHLKEEYHLLYHSLSRATEVLHISAPRSFAGQKHPAPAAILKQLPEAIQQETSDDRRTPPQIRFAKAWVSQPSPQTGADLRPLSPIGWLWNLPGPGAAEFSVDRFPLSKSSLETYLQCERRFFYEKVLRIRDEESGALTVGKLFHEVMAEIGENASSKQEFHEAATDAVVAQAISNAIKEEGIDAGTLFGASLVFHLGNMVRGALRLDRKESEDYAIEGVETKFLYEREGWEFTGRVDRLERSVGGALTILDYKSGKFDKKGDTLRDKTLRATERPDRANWQVPLYVWAYRADDGTLPSVFKHVVQTPGEDPFFVTLFIRKTEDEVPAPGHSNKKPDQPYSYLLESEIEQIIEKSAIHADAIFSARSTFGKTENIHHCRHCTFNRLCDRRTD